MSTNCPACNTPIPLPDINVAADTALCRRCGHATSYSSLIHAPIVALLSAPPDGCELRQDGGLARAFASTRSWRFFPVAFAAILLSTLVWVVILAVSRGGPRAVIFTAIPPFLAGLAFLWDALLFSIGHIEVCISQSTVTVYTGVGPLRFWRRRRRDEVREIRKEIRAWRRRSRGTLVLTGTRPLYFGSTLTENRRNFLHAAVASELITLPARTTPPVVSPRTEPLTPPPHKSD